MTRMILSSVVALLLLTAGSAFADLTPTGDPAEGGSWAQRFQESGVGNFDLVAVRMTTAGDTFESQVHDNFTDSSWLPLWQNDPTVPTIASASGNAVNWMQWDIKFAGDTSNGFAFDFMAYSGETCVDYAHAVWSGGWSITTYAPEYGPLRGTVVPVPAALVLGAIGLGLAGWIKRRVG